MPSKPYECQICGGTEFRVDPKSKSRRCPTCHYNHGVRWRAKNRKWSNELSYKNRRLLRLEVIAAYGSKCDCCGQSNPYFLAIDHVNGGGKKHRAALGSSGHVIYLWLKRNNYPRDEYRLLCHNCNLSLGFYGFCHPKLVEEEDRGA